MAVVYTNGCFNGLHQGHKDLLVKCRELAGADGTVVVGLNSDAWIRRNKKGRPIITWNDRFDAVWALDKVDFILNLDTEADIVRDLEYFLSLDAEVYLVKGTDYQGKYITGSDIEGIKMRFIELTCDATGRKLSSSEGDS